MIFFATLNFPGHDPGFMKISMEPPGYCGDLYRISRSISWVSMTSRRIKIAYTHVYMICTYCFTFHKHKMNTNGLKCHTLLGSVHATLQQCLIRANTYNFTAQSINFCSMDCSRVHWRIQRSLTLLTFFITKRPVSGFTAQRGYNSITEIGFPLPRGYHDQYDPYNPKKYHRLL